MAAVREFFIEVPYKLPYERLHRILQATFMAEGRKQVNMVSHEYIGVDVQIL
jgi:hypothetical protein